MKNEIKELIIECRDMLESKGETCPVYVGFEKESYTLSKAEIHKLAKCIYLVDCEINQSEDPNDRWRIDQYNRNKEYRDHIDSVHDIRSTSSMRCECETGKAVISHSSNCEYMNDLFGDETYNSGLTHPSVEFEKKERDEANRIMRDNDIDSQA
jgi:hypothetical protein